MAVEGWKEAEINDFFDRLSVARTYDKESSSGFGNVPILDQSQKDYFGYHDGQPDFIPDDNNPYVTFANHTCAVRLMNVPYSVIQNVFSLKAHKDVDPVFLFYLLSGKVKQDGYRGHWPEVKRLTLPKPPLKEQKKIAEILESVDDAIAKTGAVITQTQRVKQGLLQQLLTRGIGHTKFKQTELGELPESWAISFVADCCKIENNLRKPINMSERSKMRGPYPYYGPTKVLDYIDEFRVDGEYALIGEDGDHFLKHKIWPMTQFVSGKFNVNNHAHIVKGESGCLTKWFYYYFLHRDIVSNLTRQGAGRYKLRKAMLGELKIPLPSLEEQKRICALLDASYGSDNSLVETLSRLVTIKNGLMSDLLSGRVRVNIDAKSSGKIEEAA